MNRRVHSYASFFMLLMLGVASAVTIGPAQAAEDKRCFKETAYCVSGRFLQFWEQNGGLAVFGYPTSVARQEVNRDTGKTYLTQWFERNRFELHPENKAPYDVLLGRLGDDRFVQQGLSWQELPGEDGPSAGCLYFQQTDHNVCNQVDNQLGFKAYWLSHGINDPKLDAYHRSLALFGLPLTSARLETNSSGEQVITQWFERARFEWHPNKPRQFKVLLGLLGNEIRNQAPADDAARARNVAFAYFTALHDGRYHAASQLYGGSYDPLRNFNPDLGPNDHFNLFKRGCTVNSFMCLLVGGVNSVRPVSAKEFRLNLFFINADRSIFVGASGDSNFNYTVIKGADGRFRVQELPPYLP